MGVEAARATRDRAGLASPPMPPTVQTSSNGRSRATAKVSPRETPQKPRTELLEREAETLGPAPSPSESSGSSGSRSSSCKSSVSSAGSASFSASSRPEDRAGKAAMPPRHNALSTHTRSSKKRRLSAYNGSNERADAPSKRRPHEGDDEDYDLGKPGRASSSLQQQLATNAQLEARAPNARPSTRTKHLEARVAEHLFHQSSGLLHMGKLENEARASDVEDEIRRQREKQEKFERKIRSLQRELERLDPAAAAAYARGESISLMPDSSRPNPQQERPQPPEPAQHDEPDLLIPAKVPEREAAIRASLKERRANLDSFAQELRALDGLPLSSSQQHGLL